MTCHFLFSYRNDAILIPTYIDKQLNDVYVCFHDFGLQDIRYNPQETKAVYLIPFAQFEMMVQDSHTVLGSTYGKAYTQI